MKTQWDVIVVGAGAAGLMAAIEAGRRGRSVLVLERAEKIGKKIRISGGGRCNFTNRFVTPKNFVSEAPHFCKSALARYQPQDFISLVEKHGIAYHEKKLGQLFCDQTSESIIRLLEAECLAAKAEIRVNCEISQISKSEKFLVESNLGFFESMSLIIATGGLSIPQMGATGFGYEVAKSFGHRVQPCRAGLVPLLWNKDDLRIYSELSGVSVDAIVTCASTSFHEAVLFTHKGLSGPAILQISNYWKPGNPIFIDFLPDKDVMDEWMECRARGQDLVTMIARHLPKRLAQKWCAENLPAKPMSQRSARDIKDVIEKLHRWPVHPAGSEGYEKAEVTVGGVDVDEFSSKTMESKLVSGLYCVGEVMDVTGHLGGFNFQWAWASGSAAGSAA